MPSYPLPGLVLPLPLRLVFGPVFTVLGDLRVGMEGPGPIPSLLTGLVTELYMAVLCGIRWHVIPEIRLGHLPPKHLCLILDPSHQQWALSCQGPFGLFCGHTLE